MTDQSLETILINENEYPIDEQPLDQYLAHRTDIVFHSYFTSCYRGYHGTWKHHNNYLYLADLSDNMMIREKDGRRWPETYTDTTIIEYLFCQPAPVSAVWYSGKLRIDLGYEHRNIDTGYYSQLKKERTLQIIHGAIVEEHEVDHGTTYRKLEDYE